MMQEQYRTTKKKFIKKLLVEIPLLQASKLSLMRHTTRKMPHAPKKDVAQLSPPL